MKSSFLSSSSGHVILLMLFFFFLFFFLEKQIVSLSHWGVWGPGLSSSCRLSYLLKRSCPGLLRAQTSARSFPLCDRAKVGADLQAPPFFILYSPEFWAKAGSSSTSLVWLSYKKARYWSGNWSFSLRPHHQAVVCYRGHYRDRLFVILDRMRFASGLMLFL